MNCKSYLCLASLFCFLLNGCSSPSLSPITADELVGDWTCDGPIKDNKPPQYQTIFRVGSDNKLIMELTLHGAGTAEEPCNWRLEGELLIITDSSGTEVPRKIMSYSNDVLVLKNYRTMDDLEKPIWPWTDNYLTETWKR